MNNETLPAQGQVDVNVGPVAWAVFAPNGNIRIWTQDGESIRVFADAERLHPVPLYAVQTNMFPRQKDGIGGWTIDSGFLRAVMAACDEEWRPSEEEVEAVLLALERMRPNEKLRGADRRPSRMPG